MKERLLMWQITGNTGCFACTGCSWTFPNPKTLAEQQHDAAEVQRRFAEHTCNHDLPLRKFKWPKKGGEN
jgi:hypothetical protein